MSTNQPKSTLTGLPKQFVTAMRTLFDIMDDKRTGFVKFSDIESRWQEGATNLPKGVVESLRKVTPANGLLSFERFCAGLKICLLRNKTESSSSKHPSSSALSSSGSASSSSSCSLRVPPMLPYSQTTNSCLGSTIPSQTVSPIITRPQSVPADRHEREHSSREQQSGYGKQLHNYSQSSFPHAPNHVNTATIRPNIVMSQQRAISMPQLGVKAFPSTSIAAGLPNQSEKPSELRGFKSEAKLSLPPRQPTSTSSTNLSRRSGILTVLHNWQMGFKTNGEHKGKDGTSLGHVSDERNTAFLQDPVGEAASDGDINGLQSQESAPAARKLGNRRREPRRHTLTNGIDYNMLKRMKQLEQEKDVLLQGLESVDRARDWYLKQIAVVQDKMKYIGKSNVHMEYSTESHQERLNFQMARIFEVNQHLAALVESSEKGFPLHMNLAVRQPPLQPRLRPESAQDEKVVRRLKEQNHQLTEEVSKKSERITQLEREKSALIRELFQARSVNRRDVDETTFM